MKIYLAGPLFTTAEREFNVRLATLLREADHLVWLPQENEDRELSAREIFEKDVEGIDARSRSLFSAPIFAPATTPPKPRII